MEHIIRVAYFAGLALTLAVLWFALSGMTGLLMIAFAAVSIVLSLILARRFGTLNREGSPYGRLLWLLPYWMWLIVEIFRANWLVIRACLRVDLDIDPALVTVKTVCHSDLARTVFANSITLTPGTVTVAVRKDRLTVHALYAKRVGGDAFAELDRRSCRAIDGGGPA